MAKESIARQDLIQAARAEECDICGHAAPYHSLICPKVRGQYCVECEQRLPRHYTWCSRGEELGFFAWNLNCSQREVEEYFNEHMKCRAAQRAAGGQ